MNCKKYIGIIFILGCGQSPALSPVNSIRYFGNGSGQEIDRSYGIEAEIFGEIKKSPIIYFDESIEQLQKYCHVGNLSQATGCYGSGEIHTFQWEKEQIRCFTLAHEFAHYYLDETVGDSDHDHNIINFAIDKKIMERCQ